MKKRLDVYHNQTSPLKEFYNERGLYRAIEGMGGIEAVAQRIDDELNHC